MPYPKSGYTLIEVLVGLIILTLLFTGGFTAYRSFVRRQVADNFVAALRVSLNNANQSAISGVKPFPTGICNPNSVPVKSLKGYSVLFDAPYGHYYIRAVCSDDISYPTDTNFLPAGYSLQISPASVTTYLIKPLGAGTDLAGDLQITVTDTTSNYTKSITITPSGVVK